MAMHALSERGPQRKDTAAEAARESFPQEVGLRWVLKNCRNLERLEHQEGLREDVAPCIPQESPTYVL